jgi:hypothetical protein
MRKSLLGMAAVAALATASAAQADTTISLGGGSNAGDTGLSSQIYGSGPYSVQAYACADLHTNLSCDFTTIYEKNANSETGIGLANDPSGNGEIWNDQLGELSAIVLDVTGLGGNPFSFTIDSTTAGEDFNVLAWDGSSWINILNGDANGSYGVSSGYQYYAFTTDGTVNADAPNTFGNVLLQSVTVSVPEPATWAMMLLGFAGIGFAARRGRRQQIAQLA